jgi:hypothetical protein
VIEDLLEGISLKGVCFVTFVLVDTKQQRQLFVMMLLNSTKRQCLREAVKQCSAVLSTNFKQLLAREQKNRTALLCVWAVH